MVGLYGYKCDYSDKLGQDFESLINFMLKYRLKTDVNFLNVETSGRLHKDINLTNDEKHRAGLFLYIALTRGAHFKEVQVEVGPFHTH